MRMLVIALLLLLQFSTYSVEKADPQHKVKIGDTAPDFTLKYLDGKTKKLSDLKGKVIMLQFTASWCSVCNKEMPFIEEEIWQINKDNKDFQLFAIDLKENKKTIEAFIKKTKITYPILLDEDGKIFELYAEKGAGVTRNIIINKDGEIAFLTRLFHRDEFDEMKKVINQLLD